MRVIVAPLHRSREGRRTVVSTVAPEPRHKPNYMRPARLAIMLAHTRKIQTMIDRGDLKDRADAARTFGFTRARASQLLDLCYLAPHIAEAIAFMEHECGVERITERVMRKIVRTVSWFEQREMWAELKFRTVVVDQEDERGRA